MCKLIHICKFKCILSQNIPHYDRDSNHRFWCHSVVHSVHVCFTIMYAFSKDAPLTNQMCAVVVV